MTETQICTLQQSSVNRWAQCVQLNGVIVATQLRMYTMLLLLCRHPHQTHTLEVSG